MDLLFLNRMMTLCWRIHFRIKGKCEVIARKMRDEIIAGDSAYPQLQLRSCTSECTSDAKDRNAEDGGAVYQESGFQNCTGYEYQLCKSMKSPLIIHWEFICMMHSTWPAYISTAVMAKDQDTKDCR